MNDRIKELAEQATDKWVGGRFFDREKFAELIVKECIDIAFREGDNVDYLAVHFGVDQ